jgi:hypothetical protein
MPAGEYDVLVFYTWLGACCGVTAAQALEGIMVEVFSWMQSVIQLGLSQG